MTKRQQYLDKHPYKIYQGNDGKWYTYLPADNEKGRTFVKRTTQRAIEDVVINYWKDQSEDPTVADVFHEWNTTRRNNGAIAPATFDQNNRTFNRFCTEFGKKKIKLLQVVDLLDFLEGLPAACFEKEGKLLPNKAFNNLKVIIKGTLKRARRCGYSSLSIEEIFNDLDVNPKMLRGRTTEEKDDVFTEEELPVFINYLKENLDIQNIGILLMLVTGLRVGELVALKNSDIEEMDGNFLVHVQRTETRYDDANGKTIYDVKDSPKTKAGIRTVVVPPDYRWLMKKIRALNPFREYIFTNARGERMTSNCFRSRQKKVCRKLGFKPKSPHKSRKTYGSILLNNCCDLNFIKNQMGHTDITTTESYYHKDMRSVSTKAEILGNIKVFEAV